MTNEIKISNNEEYTCLKLSDEKIEIYSNKLGFIIESFGLNYLTKDSKSGHSKDKRKQDKLFKQLHNLMIKYPNLSCLLLSLLDNACLNELIENSQIPPDQSNENPQTFLNLFYHSKHEP